MGDKKRNYEATLVLDTRGSNESADSMISKMSEIIASLNGEVKKVDDEEDPWQMKYDPRHKQQ